MPGMDESAILEQALLDDAEALEEDQQGPDQDQQG